MGAWTALPGLARAADVQAGGLVFAHYEYAASEYLSNGIKAEGRNAFDISRIWLNAAAKFDDRFDAFTQLEANLSSRDNTANEAYLKQAWLRWKGIYRGADLRFGLVPTPWRGFEEGIWQHRFTAKILEDEEGLLPATDRGLSLSGKLPHLAYDAIISNGEGTGPRGTAGNEPNKFKDYVAKLAWSPLAEGGLQGLQLNAQAHRGMKMSGWPRDRNYYGVSYESKDFNLWGAYYQARDGFSLSTGTGTVHGEGVSIHGVLRCPKYPAWIFARWDLFNPDVAAPADARQRIIYGLGRRLREGIRLAVDHQLTLQEKIASNRRSQSLVSMHLEVKF